MQENATIPTASGNVSSFTMNRYKVGVISTFSNELAKVSTPAISDVFRDMVLTDTAEGLDGYLLDNVALVPGIRPSGLLVGVNS